MIKAFLFDIDGTLVDSVDLHAQAWQEAFRRVGKQVPRAEIRSQIGKGGDQLLPVFLSEEERRSFGSRIEAYKAELFHQSYLPRVQPFPMVRRLFQRIRDDGRRIALATSSHAGEVAYYKTLLRIADLVEAETTADDADLTKPHPGIVRAALHKLDIEPSEAVMVGDSPYDAAAAQKIGVAAFGVLCGGFPEADLRAAGCATIFRDPADLLHNYDSIDPGSRRAA